jgi:hypothetical protein
MKNLSSVYISYVMARLLIVAFGLFLSAVTSSVLAEGETYILTAEQWNVPRQATSVLSMPALQNAMHDYQSKQGGKLLVKYPGGDEGTLWAYELRGWLISLGVASDEIELVPGSAKSTQLEIRVVRPK